MSDHINSFNQKKKQQQNGISKELSPTKQRWTT